MFPSAESLIGVAIGIGLAAATGFRVFLPFLIAGLAARVGALPLTEGFQWLSSSLVLVALGTASVVEVAAYYIPGVDHVLDIVASPAVVLAGIIASAATMTDIPPAIMWPLAIIGGGGIAGMTKATSALVRTKAGPTTAGLANPVVSTGETMGAIGVAVASIVIPLLCLLGVLLFLFWMGRYAWRTVRAGNRELLLAGALLAASSAVIAQSEIKPPETFIAMAQVLGQDTGLSATVTIRIDQYTLEEDRTRIDEALRVGGDAGFLQALRSAPAVGYVEMSGRRVPVRWARQLPKETGRTISIVTESPIFFVGGGDVDAKPRAGFDVAVIQLDVDSIGLGTGSMAAAARVKPGGPTGVQVDDYAGKPVTLVTVRKSYH